MAYTNIAIYNHVMSLNYFLKITITNTLIACHIKNTLLQLYRNKGVGILLY